MENELTKKIIGAAIEVHRELGPGLLEKVYEKAMCAELRIRKLNVEAQKSLPIMYKGREIGVHVLDLVVENTVVIELKSVEKMQPLFESQLLSYMRLGHFSLGLLINFNHRLLKDGVRRYKL
ncbi:conserved hypothetical protein [gamma proteobacterium HTCC5015]|nr:conserved hypothetical protein [gamma proteobacterium HTCC5015]